MKTLTPPLRSLTSRLQTPHTATVLVINELFASSQPQIISPVCKTCGSRIAWSAENAGIRAGAGDAQKTWAV